MKHDPEEGWILPPRSEWPEIPVLMVQDAIALLLMSGEVFVLTASLNVGDGEVAALFVNCSDTFFWGSADAEPLPPLEFSDADDASVLELYDWVRAGDWGSTRWCCLRRGMRPQKPVADAMRRAGAWCERMEALPERS